MIESYIKRDIYLQKIEPFIDKDIIKILVGQRRAGKSYILYQIMDTLLNKGVSQKNIIYINKELINFDAIQTYKHLVDYIEQKTTNKKKVFLFIDEIQEITAFQKALAHLQATKRYDIYCTGSNSTMLSSELATHISGRYIEINVYPLSYKEFLIFHKLTNSTDAFSKYIRYGGLPFLINLQLEDHLVYEYLRNLYNTILLKDIVARHQIRNIHFLERLIEYIADNIGSLVSAKKISDFLKSQKTDISPQVVLNYLHFLVDSYFVFRISRFDINGKKVFAIGEKYYFSDLGLRHMLLGYKQMDISKILENLVLQQLLISGYNVHIGNLYNKEIDFVAEKNGEKIYIQVAYILTSQDTIDREFGNLLKIKDNYPKIVISMDENAQGNYQGIQHINIMDFLYNTPFLK
ncbi:MAG: ATP-binding protein [Gammaproteobacteria bacterium]